MMTGSEPASAFAAMIAPRRLQSPGATVQAVSAALSLVVSTSNVVADRGLRFEAANTARETDARRSDEFEETLRANFRDAPTSMASVNNDQATFLFIVMLRPD